MRSKSKTRATQDGDEYVINGKKAWITNGGFAHVFVVTAVTGEDDRGRKEITAFLVDADTKGLILGKPEHKMGQCASNTVEVTLDEVRLPASNMIGGRNGLRVMMNGLNSGRIGVAAMCCGIAQASFDAALEYSHDRTAFGKPLHQLQAIQLKLAEMATDLEAAKLLTLKAAQLKRIREITSLAPPAWLNFLLAKPVIELLLRHYRFMVEMGTLRNTS